MAKEESAALKGKDDLLLPQMAWKLLQDEAIEDCDDKDVIFELEDLSAGGMKTDNVSSDLNF